MAQETTLLPSTLLWRLEPPGLEPSVLRLGLGAGDFAELSFAGFPNGIRLHLEVFSPGGALLTRSRRGPHGEAARRVRVFAEETGEFRFELRSLERLRDACEVTATLRGQSGPLSSGEADRTEAQWAYDAAEIAWEDGDLAIASAGFSIARDGFSTADDPRALARAWHSLGEICWTRGDDQGALKSWQEALCQSQRAGDLSFQGRLWERMGDAQAALRELTAAVASYRAAAELLGRCGEIPEQISVRRSSARALLHLGYPEEALEALDTCLDLLSGIRRLRDEIAVRIDMGKLFLAVNQPRAAQAAFVASQAAARRLRDAPDEARSLKHLGDALRQAGELERARLALEQAHRSFAGLGEPALQAQALTSLGSVHLEGQDLAAAARQLERALSLLQDPAHSVDRARALVYLARCRLSRGALEQAAADFNRAQGYFARAEHRRSLAVALQGEGLAQYYRGRFRRALECSEAALEAYRGTSRTRSGLLLVRPEDIPAAAYWRLRVDSLMALHEREPEAGFHLQAVRACEQWRSFRFQRLLLATRCRARSAPGLDPVPGEGEAAGEELTRGPRRAAHPRRNGNLGRKGDPGGRRRLPAGTQSLTFFLGEAGSHLWLSTGGSTESFRLPPRSEIDVAAQTFLDLIQAPHRGSGDALRRASEELAELLFAEASPHIVGPRIVIVPDGCLSYIPFAALPTLPLAPRRRWRYLVEDFEIVLFPNPPQASSAAPEAGARGSLRAAVLSCGRPPTRGSRVPLPAPSAAIATPIEASEPHRWPQLDLRDYSLLHWTARFRNHRDRPELFELCTSEGPEPDDRPLPCRLEDVCSLDLRADLVAIALELHDLDDDIQDLALSSLFQGFFSAGARRLSVSLWQAEGRAVDELWRRFRKHFLRTPGQARIPYGEALRRAQISMLRDARWAHPNQWSAVQLYGDW